MQIVARLRQTGYRPSNKPEISLIVASLFFPNENLEELINSTKELSMKFEIILLVLNVKKDIDVGMSANRLIDSIPNLVKVTFLIFPFDEGLSHMKNVGASLATSDYLLLVDDDAEILDDIATLRDYLKKGECFGVQPLILRRDNREIIDSAGDFLRRGFPGLCRPYSRAAGMKMRKSMKGLYAEEIPSLRGAFMLIKKEALFSIGGYDETLEYIYEDVDLGWRMVLAGFRLLFVPTVKALHKGGRTTNPDIRDESYYRLSLLNFHAIQFRVTKRVVWSWIYMRFCIFLLIHELVGIKKRDSDIALAITNIVRMNKRFLLRFKQALSYRRLLAETFGFRGRKKLDDMSNGKQFMVN